MAKPNQGKLWTVEATAEEWGVHYKTVLRYIRLGLIKFVPIRRSYRIPDDQVKRGVPEVKRA